MAFQKQLEQQLQTFSGTIGIAARRLEDGLTLTHNAEQIFPAASVIKLHLLMAALQQVETGKLELSTLYPMPQTEIVAGSGILQHLTAGLELSLRDYLTLMMIVSDNTATNMIIDMLGGREKINNQLETWNLGTTRVVGKLMLPVERKNPDQLAGKLAEIKPNEVIDLLEALHTERLLNPDLTSLAIDILKRQQYTEILARYLPDQTVVASKSGQIMGVRNDVGIVYANKTYVVALCSKGCTDPRYHLDNEAVLMLGRVSKLIFDHMQQ